MIRRTLMTAALCLTALMTAGCAGAEPPAPAGGANAVVHEREGLSMTVEGEGRDLILIPGLSSHPAIWDATVAHLGAGWRIHRPHLDGFAGRPASRESGLVAAPAAEAIAAYIREAGLEQPVVVGHSMGGTIGLMLAARHPDLVGRLMVVDQLPFMGVMFGPPGTTAESVAPIADLTRARMVGSNDLMWAAGARTAIEGMILTESARAEPIRHAETTDRAVAADAMRELIVTDLRPELGSITAPVTVLYVNGPNIPLDDATVETIYQASYARLSGVVLKRIPESAHFIMFDQTERFFSELDAFVDAE